MIFFIFEEKNMIVHIFICSEDCKKFGVTQERTASNLPENSCGKGSWQFLKTVELVPNTDLFLFPFDANKLIMFIEREGFCIVSTSISTEFTEK